MRSGKRRNQRFAEVHAVDINIVERQIQRRIDEGYEISIVDDDTCSQWDGVEIDGSNPR